MLDICLQNTLLTMGLWHYYGFQQPKTQKAVLCILCGLPSQNNPKQNKPQKPKQNTKQKAHQYKLIAVLNLCGNTECDNYTRKG